MQARIARQLAVVLLGTAIALAVAGCADNPATRSPQPASTPTAAPATVPAGEPTPVPAEPTPVPAPDTPEPTENTGPVPTRTGVTDTPWGAIVDQVPADWPVYPGAEPVEPADGPASGAWLAADEVDTVARWYRDTLSGMGFTIDNLSSPLEDGTRILDVVTDLPECRIQATFRPAGDSTLISVLYGAGCAGGDA